eukprot:EG_transcript_28221
MSGGAGLDGVYHERQRLAQCAVHALNGLFQARRFTPEQLDHIAYQLTPGPWLAINPHKSALGIGNYDVNVVEKALDDVGYTLRWVKPSEDPRMLPLDRGLGFLLNVAPEPDTLWAALVQRVSGVSAHWVAVARVGPAWYNVDSKLAKPRPFRDVEDLCEWLSQQRVVAGTHLLFVQQKEDSAEPEADAAR